MVSVPENSETALDLLRSSGRSMLSHHRRRPRNLSKPNHSHKVAAGEVAPAMFHTTCLRNLQYTVVH